MLPLELTDLLIHKKNKKNVNQLIVDFIKKNGDYYFITEGSTTARNTFYQTTGKIL
jgi:arginine/lysine/ornithine decarboxylase